MRQVRIYIFHYFRYDAGYSDWDAWIWEGEKDGIQVIPSTEILDEEEWATFKIEGPVDINLKYGFKIRSRGAWDFEELGYNRFIIAKNGKLIDGDYHFYVVQGDPVIYKDVPSTKHKILRSILLVHLMK